MNTQLWKSGSGGGGAVILRAEGQVGNHVKATLGSKLVEGTIPEGGVLQLKLPGLGLWEVDTETETSDYHFTQEVKVYRYGITPCWAIAKKAFADCTPAEIQFIAKANLCRDFWQIGDSKKIVMEDEEEIYVQPYGFDHDFAEDGETKLPLTLGMKDCFKTTYHMNSSKTNVGGWATSEFRTSTLPGIFEKFPQEWCDIMTPCLKKTSEGNMSNVIVDTVDTLFLLSEFEFCGTTLMSAPGEGTQYPIFTDQESRIKRSEGVPCHVWNRSPNPQTTTNFTFVRDDGVLANATADAGLPGVEGAKLHVALAFCVG